MDIVYTYFSNGIKNLDCGFTEINLFLECAKKSLRSAFKQDNLGDVDIFTDSIGMQFLSQRIDWKYVFDGIDKKDVVWNIADYTALEYDKRFWNFPKMRTYSVMTKPFIHIDFDVVLADGFLNNIIDSRCDIFTEKCRVLENHPECLKDFEKDGISIDKIICSGLLGGNEESFGLFRKNFEFAREYCKIGNHDKVCYEQLWGIEEYNFTKTAREKNYRIFELPKNSFVHFQGRNKSERYGKLIKNLKV